MKVPQFSFQVGKLYKRAEVCAVCKVPGGKPTGDWTTGYTQHQGAFFVFCNIGVPGKTGHDYANKFLGEKLEWYGRSGSKLHHPQIKKMIDPDAEVYIFFREDTKAPFTFAGMGKAETVADETPVRVVWNLSDASFKNPVILPEEIDLEETYREGAAKQIVVNAYERNPQARSACIQHYGYKCVVCGFDFETEFGALGKEFIHVHHLTPISDIGESYEINPVRDLRPVCPNCHSMLHRRKQALSIKELIDIRLSAKGLPSQEI